MASSTERAAAIRRLGALLTGTEAGLVASGLEDGESLTAAFGVVDAARRAEATQVVVSAALASDRNLLVPLLQAIQGARAATPKFGTVWTMPGHLAQSGGLTSSVAELVAKARSSVVCSTFNFQKTSGMWQPLHDAAQRAGVSVRVYIDADVAAGGVSVPAAELAAWLSPGVVLRTKQYDGKQVRNHAKFVSVDHRFLVVTSANFSWSAEYGNVELGVQIDDPYLADRIERELRDVESHLYERVT